jgi:alpha-tubulin suppressor-like RCC1 family protein
VPSRVLGLPAITSVATGQGSLNNATHACAIDINHNVWCWGSDLFGELGNGTTGAFFAKPARIVGLKATAVSAGSASTCVITVSTQVKCWGDNNYGELGDGNTADASTPQPVGLTDVTSLAVGHFHACALVSSGAMACWGDNGNGELAANPATIPSSDVPIPNDLVDFTSLAAGFSDTCAIAAGSGKLYCWGSGFDGVLGDGSFTDQASPTPVLGLTSGVVQVSAGLENTCARTQTQVFCWGGGGAALGAGHWGGASVAAPVLVFGLTSSATGGPGTPIWLSTGYNHSCVVLYPDTVKCWGSGLAGELGNGIVEAEDIPTTVLGLPVGTTAVADQLAVGYETGCALTNGLAVECWGKDTGDGDTAPHTKAQDTTLRKAVAVSTEAGGCALLTNETLSCWGDNTYGELGNGTHSATDSSSPAAVPGLSSVVQVSVGNAHTCAIVHNAGAECWGDNFAGDLGDGTSSERDSPVFVQGLPQKPIQISAGTSTCALEPNGNVYCWGDNTYGQLGNGTTGDSSMPVHVLSLGNVVQVAAGGQFACALTTAGAVYCWGDGTNGQLGNGSSTSSSTIVPVKGLGSGVAQIAVGAGFACALKQTSGAIVCWGYNGQGELGDGLLPDSSTPVSVTGFTSGGATSIAVNDGAGGACAIDQSANSWCWGDNFFDELGDGVSGGSSNTRQAVLGIM